MSDEFHPVQLGDLLDRRLPKVVTLRAYEVYEAVYGPQPAIIEGSCRGGFGIGEIVAFLYARSFPKDEWRRRVADALRRDPTIDTR
jgi:hypothetical protein